MEQGRPLEPVGVEIVGLQAVGRAPVRDERALAIGPHQDADPPAWDTTHANRPDVHTIARDRLDERPPDCIATHGADEPCSRAQTRKPARGRRRGSALPEANLAGNVGRPREWALGFEDGVEQQVAEDHHM